MTFFRLGVDALMHSGLPRRYIQKASLRGGGYGRHSSLAGMRAYRYVDEHTVQLAFECVWDT